ncbi:MAG: UDP-N-acetylglucosamine--N-acetylmuramyl-(pentapeptide) pyrophosphoryl-undecaprenol N-acetylglucosamine transferase [Chitinophagales bacterium]|nr:MAG: UDP-N-acetylglucosamine--N-acetylmuramyl-(pentapeptide) pyrophosphoryl-undecaprenol N-acetylglucosamine transferase [Chitinophagales bacterium]
MQKNKSVKVLIAGGGTGGHVFPAIAIANALKKLNPSVQIRFVGATGRLEMTKVPDAGYPIEGLWISGFQRGNIFKNILLPVQIMTSLFKSYILITRFKPDVVVGVGGYASGPPLFVSAVLSVPVLIQEQNSFAGVTNKMMAKRAMRFCVAYDGMEKFFPAEKIVKTGNPVREDIVRLVRHPEKSRKYFDLSPQKKTILVIGGSLGSKTINECFIKGTRKIIDKGYQLIWQTGKTYYESVKSAVTSHPDIKIYDFIKEMNYAYDAADVIISRAGAIAISELCCVGKPVILVPSPNVAEDHQTKNALALVEKRAAWIVRDINAEEMLVKKTLELLANEEEQKELSTNIAKLAMPNAATRIAEEILTLAQ